MILLQTNFPIPEPLSSIYKKFFHIYNHQLSSAIRFATTGSTIIYLNPFVPIKPKVLILRKSTQTISIFSHIPQYFHQLNPYFLPLSIFS